MNTRSTIKSRQGRRSAMFLSLFFLSSLLAVLPAVAQESGPQVRKMMMKAGPSHAGLEFEGPEVRIPFETWHGRPLLEVTINGQGPYKFILDSGASGTAVDAGLAKELKLPVVGQARMGSPANDEVVNVDLVRLQKVEAAGAIFHEMECSTTDFAGLLGGGDGPRGVFSAAAFDGLLVTFDYPGGQLVLHRGALPEPDGETIFVYRQGERLPAVTIDLAGHQVTAHLDTGMPGAIALPLAIADKLNLSGKPAPMGKARTPAGEFTIYGARLEGNASVGPLIVENPMIDFREGGDQNVGTVGVRILDRCLLTLDPAQRRIRIDLPQPAGEK